MTKQSFRLVLFFLIYLSLSLTATAQTVNISDPNLRAIVENALGRTSGATITAADMEIFTIANLRNSNIRDLTWLEYAANLEVLNMGAEQVAGCIINNNSIRAISPLAVLAKLEVAVNILARTYF